MTMKLDPEKFFLALARANLTIKQVADRAGINRGSVKNALAGKRTTRPATLGSIAFALGVDVSEILQDERQEGDKKR